MISTTVQPDKAMRYWIKPTGFGMAMVFVVLIVYLVSVNNSNNLVTILSLMLTALLLISGFQLSLLVSKIKLSALPECTDLFVGESLKIELALIKGPPNLVQDSLSLFIEGLEGRFLWRQRDTDLKGELLLHSMQRGCRENVIVKGRFYSPFGFFSLTKPVAVIPRIWVYPRPVFHKEHAQLFKGRSSNITSADSIEGVKDYTPEDSMKRIRWGALAKSDQLLVNQVEGDDSVQQVELNWHMTEGLPLERRLECLSAWAQHYFQLQVPFALKLPNAYAPAARDLQHYRNCQRWLTRLATDFV
jgi:uncharacterized protein (DUF58 family)